MSEAHRIAPASRDSHLPRGQIADVVCDRFADSIQRMDRRCGSILRRSRGHSVDDACLPALSDRAPAYFLSPRVMYSDV